MLQLPQFLIELFIIYPRLPLQILFQSSVLVSSFEFFKISQQFPFSAIENNYVSPFDIFIPDLCYFQLATTQM